MFYFIFIFYPEDIAWWPAHCSAAAVPANIYTHIYIYICIYIYMYVCITKKAQALFFESSSRTLQCFFLYFFTFLADVHNFKQLDPCCIKGPAPRNNISIQMPQCQNDIKCIHGLKCTPYLFIWMMSTKTWLRWIYILPHTPITIS